MLMIMKQIRAQITRMSWRKLNAQKNKDQNQYIQTPRKLTYQQSFQYKIVEILKMALKQMHSIESSSIETQKLAAGNRIIDASRVNDELNLDSSKPTKNSTQYEQEILDSSNQSSIVQKTNIWSSEQIRTLFTLFKQLGSRWTSIAKMIPTKSENSIKNKFNCCMRKFTRKLNKINKQSYTKFRKQIRTQSVFRIIEAAQLFPNMETSMKLKSIQIRQRILIEARKEELNEEGENIIELINDINNFNLKTRSHKNPKHKRRKDIILFEPAKEFSDTCRISYDGNIQKIVNPNIKNIDDKIQPNMENNLKCSQKELQSCKKYTNTFLYSLDNNNDDSFILPLEDLIVEEENENCLWNSLLNDEKFQAKDRQLWYLG